MSKITPEMTVEQLVKLLQIHSVAIAEQEKKIGQLTKLNKALLRSLETLNERQETLRTAVEGLNALVSRLSRRPGGVN